ncbi:hypothetical protein DFH06DRAFT_1320535 [Mycena polygramma]|nr:hypothetical protein DFH06DRAFT_1320535 [Mycena polygramma]
MLFRYRPGLTGAERYVSISFVSPSLSHHLLSHNHRGRQSSPRPTISLKSRWSLIALQLLSGVSLISFPSLADLTSILAAIVAVADLAIISVYVVALVKKNDFRWQHILMLVILVLADLIAPLFAGHAWGMHQAQLQAQAQVQGQGPLEAGLLRSPPPEMASR